MHAMSSEPLVLGIAFALFAVPAGVIDAKRYRVPNVCTIGGTPVLLALRILVFHDPIASAILGPALGGSLFMLVRMASRGRLGLGDVKLSMLIGAATGPFLWPVAVAAGSLVAAIWAIAASRRRGVSVRRVAIPYAPFLAAGALASLITRALVPAFPFPA
jgi:prepilin signal peptidase PulO-like enzyme (type II secretory pathway)